MIVLRKRLLLWLIKAYAKRWGKNIAIYFGVGLFVFFLLNVSLSYFIVKLPFLEKETVGMVGPYTVDNLPDEILNKISRGLTKIDSDGAVKPDIAEKWKISPDGKSYAFFLRKNIRFSDGSSLTSDKINYNFSDVSIVRPDKHTIVFNLKDSYSPFLTTVSRPIFKKAFIGIGDYKVKNVKFNDDFIESIEMYSQKYNKTYIYQLFYPTVSSLKTAFLLGDVSRITNLPDVDVKDISFDDFKNAKVTKKVNDKKLVTLFFNTRDSVVSSKTLREGLWYTIPDVFLQGERNASPLSHYSYGYQKGLNVYRQDLEHAKILIDDSNTATESSKISIKIQTLSKYQDTAKIIANIWKNLGIETEVSVVNKVPSSFQVFLGEFNLSSDPDQYTLWHSGQVNNITRYDNKRIDKLLEDGRKEHNKEKRIAIYSDFQKYIISDPPAAFLFFPFEYEVQKS
jgi:peptide/nickel transport system substrate-binding protein